MVAVLALGTVQLGMAYGVANEAGQPTEQDAVTLLQAAVERGVTHIDTARAYGEAEARVGAAHLPDDVLVSTKLAPEINRAEDVALSVRQSCEALQCEALDVLMLHRWQHWQNDAVREALEKLKDEGVVKVLGASVQSPEEAAQAASVDAIGFLQLPNNVLDDRFDEVMQHKREGLHVQVRSSLLQGLLTLEGERWPDVNGASYAKQLDSFVEDYGRESRVDLAYAFVRALPWVNSVVVGMENLSQLGENIRLFANAPLLPEQVQEIRGQFSNLPESLLNPARW